MRLAICSAASHCEYVTEDALERLLQSLDAGQPQPLIVAIGLETTSDFIREKSIDKGKHVCGFHSYKRSCPRCQCFGQSMSADEVDVPDGT